MNSNLVSIIMPAFNGERFINQAIESVLAQTYPHWELIIIDDGSTDNTAQLVSVFKDQRIVYFYQENRGQAATLNRGLDVSRGEYITTLDVDDWFTPNSLGDRVDFLNNHRQYDVVYGDGIFCDINGNKIKQFSELRTYEVTGDVFDVMLSNSFFGTGANVMIRKDALVKYQLRYDETVLWCQDYDLYLRLAEKCQFGYVHIPTVWYRLHTGNMTLTMPTGLRKESLVRVKKKALNSARFPRTAESFKVSFFFQLLLADLDDLSDKLDLINHSQFLSLSKPHQANLIRYLATQYLQIEGYIQAARSLYRRAIILNPLDIKSGFLLLLSYMNKNIVKWVIDHRQILRAENRGASSPFDLVKAAK